ncbi:MAG TPA: nucleotide exchange factor GrpE [Blastocatellia bacterium]|nr:nucleotide exchange factor GrpE [Blastocatellia bacterium]
MGNGDDEAIEVEATAPEGVDEAPAKSVKVVDKRRFARFLGFGGGDDEVDDDAAGDERHLPSYVEELKQRAERAEAHSKAEIEAARTRLERHFEGRLASARSEIAAGVLEVFDNLERALSAPAAHESALYEGILATRDIFLRKLDELGISAISSVGEVFDPEIHEAVDEVVVDDPAQDGRVVEEMQRGFRCGERLVRPAIVRVGRATPDAADAAATGE